MSVVEQDEPTPPASVPLHRRLPGGRTLRDGHRIYWWGEIIAVLAFYGIYTFIRNLHHGNPQEAFFPKSSAGSVRSTNTSYGICPSMGFMCSASL